MLENLAHPLSASPPGQFAIDKTLVIKKLLVNGGHIGDVLITTAFLTILLKAIPRVSIGFLTGTYSKDVIHHHPCVSRVHFLDHWYLNRSNKNKLRSFLSFRRQAQQVIRDLRVENYDLAIDLRAWFPNFISITLQKAEIPIRIGYDRVGGGSLLTHAYKYQYDRRHELHHQLDLLKPLSIEPDLLEKAKPCLPSPTREDIEQTKTFLHELTRFCILHPGSGSPVKDWPEHNCIKLAQNLIDRGIVPVITGRGTRDAAIARAIALGVPSAINLCDVLSWENLLTVIGRAEVVVSVDTSVGHIASAMGTRVISVYGGMADPLHWAPLGAQIVANPISCYPCFKKNGCSHRSCLTGITVDQVEIAVDKPAADQTS